MKSNSRRPGGKFSPVAFDPCLLARRFAIANAIPSPLTDAVLADFSAGRHSEVKRNLASAVHGAALDPHLHRSLRQFGALLTKLDIGESNLADVALGKFLDSEDRCRDTNARLGFDLTLSHIPDDVRAAIFGCRRLLRESLPPVTDGLRKRIILDAYPGPGLTLGTLNSKRTSPAWKVSATELCSTSRAMPYARWLVSSSKLWQNLVRGYGLPTECFKVLEANTVSFVPKDATSRRTIAIEPSLNIMLQLGVKVQLDKVLNRLGNTTSAGGQERNQALACRGSVDGSLATIDLSSASDTISLAIVRQCLPADWCALLFDLRSPKGVLPDGTEVIYEKFSSMGNGFTFPLETLIFLGLARYFDPTASCYGDDIIVATEAAAPLIRVLEFCGFSVNSDKSFLSGPFRESCGFDAYNGKRVTPVYLRVNPARADLGSVFAFVNQIRNSPLNWGSVLNYLRQCLGDRWLPVLPTCPIDSGVHSSTEGVRHGGRLRFNKHLQTYECLSWRFRPSSDQCSTSVDLSRLGGLAFGDMGALPLRGEGRHVLRWHLS